MILGLGIDIFAVSRMRKELSQKGWQQEDGIFTAAEVSRCRSFGDPARGFAGCFAGKEAATKALGVRVSDLGMFGEVEIDASDLGRAQVSAQGRLAETAAQIGARRTHASIAHGRKETGAIVIIES